MDPNPLATTGRLLVGAGVVLVVAGLVALLLGRAGFGRLPGDIAIEGKRVSFYFPLATSLLLSALLTLAIWIVQRLRG